MAKHDLGTVAMFPWVDLYEFFNVVPSNFDGKGGYIQYKGKTYVMMCGVAKGNITLPTPNSTFELSLVVNDEIKTITFSGNIALINGDTVEIATVYKN